MIKPLELPHQLKGPWERALFMSYGVNFPFFENALWSQFAARCRQKIILLDGKQYLAASAQHAQDGLVRHLNHRYVAAGVFKHHPHHAVHAKLILLVNEERGRLLVGSGNLNWQGYASGGELFCVYEYEEEAGGELAAFTVVGELLQGLINGEWVDAVAARYIRQFLEHTPWLHRSVDGAWLPVRHNLKQSFLQQLTEVIAGEPVEALWVLSPFYDPAAVGLRQLLAQLRPQLTHLLVQPGQTSVDPVALAQVLAEWGGKVQIHPVEKEDNPYLHAKLYLVQTGTRAICLQGSANLSQVAMLRTAAEGNVELCNLLCGGRDAFDYLWDALIIHEPVALETLSLSLEQKETGMAVPTAAPFYLTGGEWDGRTLTLDFRGKLPDLSDGRLIIGDSEVPFLFPNSEGRRLRLEVAAAHHPLLKETVSVTLRWRTGCSNPVFVYDRASLHAEMQARPEEDNFRGLGDLDIDEDLGQLVSELENALVIDRRSVWRLAGRRARTKGVTDEELAARPLNYDEIDYEALRCHPKTQQYLQRGLGRAAASHSGLQLVLSRIMGRFYEIADLLREPAFVQPPQAASVPSETADTEEESETEEVERHRRRQSDDARRRQLFKRFIGRYLQGIESADFRKFVGYEVVAHNYIIFDHLLWELSLREWFQPERPFLTESQERAWQMFWGNNGEMGYLDSLAETERMAALAWVREQKSDARLLAAVWHAATELTGTNQLKVRNRLRDLWRHLLGIRPFPLNEELLTDAWVFVAQTNLINPPPAITIVETLASLANDETEDEFLRSLERDFGFPQGSCRFKQGKFHGGSIRATLHCSSDNQVVSAELAQQMLSRWMRYESLDSYRMSFGLEGSGNKILLYDEWEKTFWDTSSGQEIALQHTAPDNWPWEALLAEMRSLAKQIGQVHLAEMRPMESAISEVSKQNM